MAGSDALGHPTSAKEAGSQATPVWREFLGARSLKASRKTSSAHLVFEIPSSSTFSSIAWTKSAGKANPTWTLGTLLGFGLRPRGLGMPSMIPLPNAHSILCLNRGLLVALGDEVDQHPDSPEGAQQNQLQQEQPQVVHAVRLGRTRRSDPLYAYPGVVDDIERALTRMDTIIKRLPPLPPSHLWLGLHVGDPADARQPSNWEVVGGTYSRQAITFTKNEKGVTANLWSIAFGGMPYCSVSHFGLWTHPVGGTLILSGYFGRIYTAKAGDTFMVDPGALTSDIPLEWLGPDSVQRFDYVVKAQVDGTAESI